MKTKFIDGTDKQYSIREDGSIIRNYKWRGRKEYGHIEYKKVVLKYKKCPKRKVDYLAVRSNGKVFNWFKNSLLSHYFNFIICPKCNKKIKTDKHIRVCPECIRKARNIRSLEWRKNNKETYKLSLKKSYYKNKEKYSEIAKNKIKNLDDSYVISKLKIPTSFSNSTLIEIKRNQLKLHRQIKSLKENDTNK